MTHLYDKYSFILQLKNELRVVLNTINNVYGLQTMLIMPLILSLVVPSVTCNASYTRVTRSCIHALHYVRADVHRLFIESSYLFSQDRVARQCFASTRALRRLS